MPCDACFLGFWVWGVRVCFVFGFACPCGFGCGGGLGLVFLCFGYGLAACGCVPAGFVGVWLWVVGLFLLESLILAQDERWRRA